MRFRPTLLILAGFIGTASAHETWILPSSFDPKVGEEVRFDLTSGMDFPALENAIQADRVTSAMYRLGKDRTPLLGLEKKEKALRLTESFPSAGLATVWVALGPRSVELTDQQVEEYFEEIGATSQTRAAWARQKGSSAWKETYTKQAKTFVAVGNASGDTSWRSGVGMALELVPVTDPLSVRAGQEMTAELLGGGKPLAGVPVGLRIRGTTKPVFETTDAKGRVTFAVSQPGEAMLFSVHLRPAADGASWKGDFTNLTFLVR